MIAIIGVFTYAIVQTMMRARVRELEIRERIAMIERGLVPPPEVDPRGFERAMNRYERVAVWPGATASASAGRHRRAGITLIGVGLGLMLLISVAGETPEAGVGVGGFLSILGLAFLVNSLFELRQGQPPAASRRRAPMAPSARRRLRPIRPSRPPVSDPPVSPVRPPAILIDTRRPADKRGVGFDAAGVSGLKH